MKKKYLGIILAAALLLSMTPISVQADSSDSNDEIQNGYVVLGEDLTEQQKETVLSIMNLTEDQLDEYDVLTVSNEEEHQYLDAYLSSSVIGTKALSSVMVTPTETGSGLSITTENINYCTVSMYQNALITAGLEDAQVIVAAPFEISGTAALIGAVKAYSDSQGEEINEEALEAATNELVLTGELGDSLGDNEDATSLIAYVKQKVVEGNLSSQDDIAAAVKEGAQKLDVTLTDEQVDQIVSLMQKISKLDIDPDALKTQAQGIFNKLKDMGLDIDSQQASNFLVQIWQAIVSFFKSLFH